MRQGPPVGTNNFDLDLGVWPIFLKTITMLRTFELWVLELIHFTWIFVVTKSFHGYQHFFTLWPWPLKLTYFQETLIVNFEQFVMEVWCFIWILYDMTFPWIPTVFDLMTFTLELDLLFEKLLALLRTFEMWVLVLMHFTWIFLVAMPFRGYQHFFFIL